MKYTWAGAPQSYKTESDMIAFRSQLRHGNHNNTTPMDAVLHDARYKLAVMASDTYRKVGEIAKQCSQSLNRERLTKWKSNR